MLTGTSVVLRTRHCCAAKSFAEVAFTETGIDSQGFLEASDGLVQMFGKLDQTHRALSSEEIEAIDRPLSSHSSQAVVRHVEGQRPPADREHRLVLSRLSSAILTLIAVILVRSLRVGCLWVRPDRPPRQHQGSRSWAWGLSPYSRRYLR